MERSGPRQRRWRCPGGEIEHAMQNTAGAALHFGSRAPRKGQQQYAPRIGASADEMCDAIGERMGLAGARAGDDQKRSAVVARRLVAAVLDGAALFGVQ